MSEDGPNGSPYETLAKHDQSETKHDTLPGLVLEMLAESLVCLGTGV
jgi:hypothetical protein